jgi:hypothetical protein
MSMVFCLPVGSVVPTNHDHDPGGRTMGLLDALKGLLGGEAVQNVLESTGLSEHVDGFLGEGAALSEALGGDAGQVVETLGIGEVLPGGLGEVVEGAVGGAPPELPV